MTMRSVLTLVLIVFAVMPGAAQVGIGFGPQIGIYQAQGVDGIRLMGGAALRLRFSEALGVEASVNYRQEEYVSGFVTGTAKSWPVMVTGLLYPIPVVYGAVGAGWYNTTIDYSYNPPPGYLGSPVVISISTETQQQFGWHFGGGVELSLGSAAKLTGDIRYVFLDYNFKNVPGNGASSNFYVITAGLLFGV